jgi:hypothetical protein
MGSLFYPLHIVRYFTDRLAWWQAFQLSPLFHFAVIRSPRVSLHYTAINVGLASQICEERLLASSCLSIRMEQLGSHGTDFHAI